MIGGVVLKKLPDSWNDYKQQFKHKHRQLSLVDLITYIIIEDTNKKEMTIKANLVEGNSYKKATRINLIKI